MKNKTMFKMRFYQTYYFSSLVQNMLIQSMEFLRERDDFYNSNLFSDCFYPFKKFSALHNFAFFVINNELSEETLEVNLEKQQQYYQKIQSFSKELQGIDPKQLPIDISMRIYGISCDGFDKWLIDMGKDFLNADQEDIYDYFTDLQLSSDYDVLIKNISNEVFFILFQNRGLMKVFNETIASAIEYSSLPEEIQMYFDESSTTLKPVLLPQWVKQAVFDRDRGACALCQKDLSGTLNIDEKEIVYDYIVPLSQGGLNDVSNIQVLCKICNAEKSEKSLTSDYYKFWYPISEDDFK